MTNPNDIQGFIDCADAADPFLFVGVEHKLPLSILLAQP